MNFFVIGYFGRNNLGDETILEVFTEWAQRNFSEADFRVLSAAPLETEKRHIVRTVGRGDARGILSAIRWCDAVVAPGGGLLQDSTSARSALYYAGLFRLARIMGKPVYVLSQGIGPLSRKWTRGQAARALAGCSRVWARDEKSASALDGVHPALDTPPVSADMVFLLPGLLEEDKSEPADSAGEEPCGAAADGSKPPLRIGISLRPAGGLEQVSNALAGCVLRLAEKYSVELRLYAFDAGEDSAPVNSFAEEIRRRAPEMKFLFAGALKESPPAAADTLRAIAGLDVFVGMRLHSLVFSALAGTPFIALPYDPKVKAFAEICGQPAIGNLESVSSLEISSMITSLLEKPRSESTQILADVCNAEREKLGGAMSEFREDLEKLPPRSPAKAIGIPISLLSFPGAIRKILESTRSGKRLHIVTVNPEMIMRARREPEFRELLTGGTVNTADGVGVRAAIQMRYRKKIEPVTGVDITNRLLELSRSRNLKIFMLGGRPEVIEEVAESMREHPARPLICGTHHGYLDGVDTNELAKKIRDSGADIVLAGMGVPLQEYWIRDNAEAAGASVYMGVGGVFDVLSGKVVLAPGIFRKTGMEWVWRVAGDPRRIRRLASFPLFILLSVFNVFRGDRSDKNGNSG